MTSATTNLTQEVYPGIFCVDHSIAEGKNGVIFGQRRAMVVDVGMLPAEGDALDTLVRQRGFAPGHVVITHGHTDHVLGGRAFAGADVFASDLTPNEIRRHLAAYAARKQLNAESLLAQALWPTVTFSGELTFDLGGRVARLLPLPGHSSDMVVVYLPTERILFASDTVVNGIVPAIGDGDSRMLEYSLRKLLTWDIDILIPGHGHVLTDASAITRWLNWEITYLSSIRAALADLLRTDPRVSIETAMLTITFEQYVGTQLPPDKHNMPNRHRNTVSKILDEERAALIG